MRRALTFFVISTILFIISRLLLSDFELNAGIFSILLALIYILFPVHSTKALALIPNVPLGIFCFAFGLALLAILVSICLLEFAFPLILGYVIVIPVSKEFGTTIMIISLIAFITTWLFLRKYQWRWVQIF